MTKALFFDIDGTLVPLHSLLIPDDTIALLNKLRDNNVKLFLATGRPVTGITNFINQFKFDGYLTSNGQVCYDQDFNIIHSLPLKKESVIKSLEYANNHKIGFAMCSLNQSFRNAQYIPKFIGDFKDVTLDDILNNDIYQVMVRLVPEQDKEFEAYVPGVKAKRWNNYSADIMPIEGGKDSGIDAIIKHYRIDLADTVAFGDGGNDIDMLKHCHIGVAMGNGMDEVKENADYITTSVDDNGILNACKHLGII